MKNYRLKKEAVQFFQKRLASEILTLDIWKSHSVDIIALEEVEDAYIKFGHTTSESSTSLCGWDEKGSRFHFTIYFPSVKIQEHDRFRRGESTRRLMDMIQSKINNYYSEFVHDEKP